MASVLEEQELPMANSGVWLYMYPDFRIGIILYHSSGRGNGNLGRILVYMGKSEDWHV
jgi:hypothetical protein